MYSPQQAHYRVLQDRAQFSDLWFLHGPLTADHQEIDAREFTEGRRYEGPPPAIVPIGQAGRVLEFSFGSFDMPVVSEQVAAVVAKIASADVQFLPVQVSHLPTRFQILNALHGLDCLDETRSKFTRWQEGDHRPDLIGQYYTIEVMRIDPDKVRGHHMFRIRDWPIALLVSETLKAALAEIPNLGVVFEPVS